MLKKILKNSSPMYIKGDRVQLSSLQATQNNSFMQAIVEKDDGDGGAMVNAIDLTTNQAKQFAVRTVHLRFHGKS